jgi:signal transduction histidine kinase/ligand-binding sensor domain-containing protein
MVTLRASSSVARTLATFFALATAATALQPDHSLTQYGHTSWSWQDGRLPGAVNAVTQALDGSVWVGTDFGLFWFDGETFSSWKAPVGTQLPDQRIWTLAPAPDGGLWIGTRKGLSYWKGARLDEYLTSQDANAPSVSSLVVDHAGNVWLGTAGFNSGRLCRINAYRMKCYGPLDGYNGGAVQALLEDKVGNLWIGGVGGLFEWNSGGFRHYGPNRSIQAIGKDLDGNIIVLSPGGLSQLTGERLTPYSVEKAIHNAHPEVLFSDRNGGLWIGTAGEGLLHVYQQRVDQFTRADGLSGDTVLRLFEDREGNVWVATDKGLDRFWNRPVTILSKREGLSTDVVVSAFASEKNGVWLGTTQGLNRVWRGRIDANGPRFSFGRVGSLFEDRSQTLWIDSDRGLAFTESGAVQQLKLSDGQQIGSITAVTQDASDLWFSDVNHGLTRVEGHKAVSVIPWSRFDNRVAWALEANPVRGGLLIGFAQGGVAVFEKDRVSRWYGHADGLGSGAVTDLHFDTDGTAWIATEGGLSQLKNGRVTTLGSNNGLPCAQIHSMVEDDDRNLWLNTPCGLVRITRPDLTAWSDDPKIRVEPKVFGVRDGMHPRPRKYGFFRGAVKSTDGRLWFPELDGVAIVDPRHLPHNLLPPPVEIKSILADQAALTVHPGLKLPHISRELQIDYTAFSFVDPERVLFKYKLQGYDANWINAGNRRQAVYPSLPPAKYVFRVIACNNDGVWNDVGASLDFTVAPIFYQTIWFRLLAAIGLAGIAWMVYSLRVRHLEAKLNLRFEERMKERTRISRDLHDTLLQNISGFALQLDALSKMVVTAPQSARDQLRELRRQAETWLREARESVWELRLPASDQDDLATAIRTAGNEILGRKNIAFEIRISGRRHAVDSQTKQSLIRIVQEAFRNAASHSNAGKIDVHIAWLAGHQLSLEIRDDGRGFDFDEASRKSGHFGLASMRERAREIGAQFQIDASPGQGVRIEIRCPLTPAGRLKHDRESYSHTHRR